MFKCFDSTAPDCAYCSWPALGWECDKIAAKWRSSLSPYTISTSEFSDEEDTVSQRSSPSIDICESKEEDSEQESSNTENSPEERNQEDSKRPWKRKQLTRRDKNLADIFLAFIKGN